MSEKTEHSEQQEAPQKARSVRDGSRRRLLRRGLAAAPVLLTLVSRPVLGGGSGGGNWGGGGNWTVIGKGGGGGNCVAPSGFISMPTSQHGKGYSCSGCTPEYWTKCDVTRGGNQWPSPYCATTSRDYWGNVKQPTMFRQPFSPCKASYLTSTMLNVLEMAPGPQNDVARYCSAALLNAASGRTPVLTEDKVKGIWSEYASKGYFEPTAGVKWDGGDIVTYLRSTMTG